MEEVWFKYLVDHKEFWPFGFTKRRLEKVKHYVLASQDIMWDLLDRHNGRMVTPQQMREEDSENFDHAISNFASSTLHMMVDKGIYKL